MQGYSMEIAASDCVASFDVEIHQEGAPSVSWDGTGVGIRSPYSALVTMNRELHQAGSDRSCLHLELNIQGCEVRCHLPAGQSASKTQHITDRSLVNLYRDPGNRSSSIIESLLLQNVTNWTGAIFCLSKSF